MLQPKVPRKKTENHFIVKWAGPRLSSPDWNDEPDAVVWVSVEKLDQAWMKGDNLYIGHGGSGAAIEDRYVRFGQWLFKTAKPVEMPIVSLNGDGVAFTDGRHRFAWLRDHGVSAIPVQVPPEEATKFEKRFGTSKKVSIVTKKSV